MAEGAHGYLMSSLELRTGLEVSALAFTLLPADLLREFHRLHRCWDDLPVLLA
jgi:hypothetical protein